MTPPFRTIPAGWTWSKRLRIIRMLPFVIGAHFHGAVGLFDDLECASFSSIDYIFAMPFILVGKIIKGVLVLLWKMLRRVFP